jgi:hypothetical protein
LQQNSSAIVLRTVATIACVRTDEASGGSEGPAQEGVAPGCAPYCGVP